MQPKINLKFTNIIKRKKILWISCGFLVYSLAIASITTRAVQIGFAGMIIRIIKRNIKVPTNYIKSFSINNKPLIIDINYKDLMKLEDKRLDTINKGMLIVKDSDWVNFSGKFDDKKLNGEIRLKGLLSDHWSMKDNNYSYKIKLKEDNTILGMKRFSIQHPRTRNYMVDWYFQKMLKQQGIISARYFYKPVIINGRRHPIYQFEEGFEKRLIENNERREGPIFKLFYRESVENNYVPGIFFYQKNKWIQTSQGKRLLRRVERLIYGFKNGELNAEEVFDVKLFAKTFAVLDLFGHHHAAAKHNIRFYLNPISGLIEPIPFDATSIYPLQKWSLIGEDFKMNTKEEQIDVNDSLIFPNISYINGSSIMAALFKSAKFNEEYLYSLNTFSKKDWLDKFFENNFSEEERTLNSIYRSYPWYKFEEKKILYSNQKYILNKLNPNNALRAFIKNNNSTENLEITISNNHTLPVEILGISKNNDLNFYKLDQSIIVPNKPKICSGYNCFNQLSVDQVFINKKIKLNKEIVNSQINQYRLVSRVVGSNKVFSDPLFNYDELNDSVPLIEKLKKLEFIIFDNKSKEFIIKSGNWNISEDLVIPSGYFLKINEKTTLNLIENSAIISYSPIKFIGSEDFPILIKSNDLTGQGLLVINADKESIIKNVIFSDLTMYKKAGLILTGGVSFYESNVNIESSTFLSNKSEDALNIIRSNFIVKDTIFDDIFSDAIDLDFSDGFIQNVSFTNIGNDGIDLSGSDATIENATLNQIGDKGISIGEKSNANLKNIKISKSNIGLACKDSSYLKGLNINIEGSEVGFTSYQKKPEFGKCAADFIDIKLFRNIYNYLIEEKSIISIDNENINPNAENIYQRLYGL